MFRYINQVLRDKKNETIWQKIENVRQELKNDHTPIPSQSFGAIATPPSSFSTVANKAKQTAIPPVYGQLLYRTVAYFNANKILEMGTGTGISTLYLGSAPVVNQLISLEGNAALASLAKNQANKLKLNKIEVISGDFHSTLSTALSKLGNIDLAFIDGNHQKAPTLQYYEQILPYTHNDTVLIFDDIHWSPEMLEAWQEIIARPEVTLSLDLYRMGMIFFRKEIRQAQHIQLYYW